MDRYHRIILRKLENYEKLRYDKLEALICKSDFQKDHMSPATFGKKLKDLVTDGRVKHFKDPDDGIGWYTTKKRFVKGTFKAIRIREDLKNVETDLRHLRSDWPHIDTRERIELITAVVKAIALVKSQASILLALYPDNIDLDSILKRICTLSKDLSLIVTIDTFERDKLANTIRRTLSNELKILRGDGILSSLHRPG